MPEVPDALAVRNKSAVQQASPFFDRINSSWEKAEEYFRSQGILAPVDYCYHIDEYENSCCHMGLQKIGGKWRICYGESQYQCSDPDAVHWTLVNDTPVFLRSYLFKHLPKLLERLVEVNESVLPQLQKSADDADAILKSLGIE